MKSGHRGKAYRLWRSQHDGLKKLAQLVDKAIAEKPELDRDLADLKVKVHREIRENSAWELKYRREDLELQDMELAHKLKTPLLLRLKAKVEAEVEKLLALNDLREALGPDPEPAATEPAPQTSEAEASAEDGQQADPKQPTENAHEPPHGPRDTPRAGGQGNQWARGRAPRE